MKIGIFGGGFKPFTTGHFSKLSLSLSENDVTYLFYGVSPRMKNSDFLYTGEMAEKVFDIVKSSLNDRFGDKIIVQKGVPTPLVEIFLLIERIKDDKDSSDLLTVYSGKEDEHRFTKYINTPHEEKYFGNLVKSNRLLFKSSNICNLTKSMKNFYPKLSNEKIESLIKVKGSVVRGAILKNDIETVKNYMPSFLFETRYNGHAASDEIIRALWGENR